VPDRAFLISRTTYKGFQVIEGQINRIQLFRVYELA